MSEKARETVSNYMAAASTLMGEYSPVSLAFLDEACDSLPIVQAFARFEADVRREYAPLLAAIHVWMDEPCPATEQGILEAYDALAAIDGGRGGVG